MDDFQFRTSLGYMATFCLKKQTLTEKKKPLYKGRCKIISKAYKILSISIATSTFYNGSELSLPMW